MATTANTILKSSTTQAGTYTKLVDIKSYPDMAGEPNKIDSTDLSATTDKTFEIGLREAPDLTFECNYTKAGYRTLQDMEGELTWFQLELGDDGVDGILQWSGKSSVRLTGGGVDEIRGMSLTLSAETPVVLLADTPVIP